MDAVSAARRCAALACALALGAALAGPAGARVTQITVVKTESPTYGGQSFGTVGQYEKIIGTASGEIDPADRHNAIIQDILLAPRNANGKVEYTASFTLVKPIDMSKGNGVLFYNIVNRGNRNFPYTRGDPGDRLARGTAVGHLLECAGQLCGGYFADPGRKDVPGMAHLGFPYADVDAEGNATLAKVDGTGGAITLATATEQLLYEVTDPFGYVTPDVTADFSTVELREIGPDRVRVTAARGRAAPARLKVSVGYAAGYVGEGEIGYAGANAMARARLAADIVRERLGGRYAELRIDLIGSTSLHGRAFDPGERPYEVRLRVAARAPSADAAALVGDEVEALYTNGPAGGGGTRKYVHEQIGIVSTLIDRARVTPHVTLHA